MEVDDSSHNTNIKSVKTWRTKHEVEHEDMKDTMGLHVSEKCDTTLMSLDTKEIVIWCSRNSTP